MGTSNFYNKNASKVFAQEIETEWDHEDLFENLKYALKRLSYSTHPTLRNAPSEDNGLRSFYGVYLGGKGESKFFGDCEVFVGIKPIMRNGYYSGVNLDWEINAEVGGFDADQYAMDDVLRMDYGMNRGMAKIQAGYIENWIDSMKSDLIDELEGLFAEQSTPLVVTARFSNGETMYAKAN